MNRRRSWALAPAHDPEAVKACVESDADVVVLDLEYSVPPKHKEAARAGLKGLVQTLSAQSRVLFVRIDRDARWADAAAAVVRGVNGIILPGAEQADEVTELDQLVTTDPDAAVGVRLLVAQVVEPLG